MRCLSVTKRHHFPYSKDFVVSPVYNFIPYSKELVVSIFLDTVFWEWLEDYKVWLEYWKVGMLEDFKVGRLK